MSGVCEMRDNLGSPNPNVEIFSLCVRRRFRHDIQLSTASVETDALCSIYNSLVVGSITANVASLIDPTY
jgi:hypothetical protein